MAKAAIKEEPLDKQLWKAADKLRKNIDAAEYKHVVMQELDYVLTPGRYVGLPDEEDDFNFTERFSALKTEFEAQLKEEATLNQAIAENLQRIKL